MRYLLKRFSALSALSAATSARRRFYRRLIGGILLCVCRGAGQANVVRLRAVWSFRLKDHAVQDVLVRLPLLARLVVDAEDAYLFVLELDFVVPAVHRHRIELDTGAAPRRAFQVNLENANRVIADILGDVGLRSPGASERRRGGIRSWLTGSPSCGSSRRCRGRSARGSWHVRSWRSTASAAGASPQLRAPAACRVARDRGGRGRILSPQAGSQQQRERLR